MVRNLSARKVSIRAKWFAMLTLMDVSPLSGWCYIVGVVDWLIDYTVGQMESEFVIHLLDTDWVR